MIIMHRWSLLVWCGVRHRWRVRCRMQDLWCRIQCMTCLYVHCALYCTMYDEYSVHVDVIWCGQFGPDCFLWCHINHSPISFLKFLWKVANLLHAEGIFKPGSADCFLHPCRESQISKGSSLPESFSRDMENDISELWPNNRPLIKLEHVCWGARKATTRGREFACSGSPFTLDRWFIIVYRASHCA